MFNIIRPGTNFDFVGPRKIWLSISLLMVLGTVGLFFTKGLNLGIDFTGGAEIHVAIPQEWKIADLRQALTAEKIKGLRLQQIGEASENQYVIRAQGDEKSLNEVSAKVRAAISTKFQEGEGAGQFAVLKEDVVGAAAGGILREKGFLAMFYALLVILIYVGLRFDSRYAPGAVMALFHDSMIVLGVFMIAQFQFDLTILAAMLALVGYSNNDTIIVFDRVRETIQLHPEYSIEKAVNRAINDTIGRTIVTSLTTFFVVSSLYFFGGSVIKNFAFTLMVGVVVGTYSSIFIASNLIITLTRWQKKREEKQRLSGKSKKRKYQVRPEPRLG